MIRAFVAVPIPDDIAREIEGVQAGLPAGRAVPRENLHLTLAFLGSEPEPVLEDLHLALERLRAPAFEMKLQGIGLFERSLHAGGVAPRALKHLRDKVGRAASDTGIEVDRRRFQPHVTLARFSRPPRGEEAAELDLWISRRVGFESQSFPVDSFALYESRLGRQGPSYSVLAEYGLTAEAPTV